MNNVSSWHGVQYQDTGWFGVVITLLLVSFILINIARAGKNQNLFIRRIAGLNAIDEAIGRATEMGRPVLMVPGLGDLNAISVQALNIFAYVSRTAARFSNPIRLCCGNAAVYTVAQEIIRDAYQQEGLADRYDQDSVRFLSDRQFAFAAAVSGLILREQAAAAFFLGEFFAESLIFAETANSVGAIQIASSTQSTQTPFFIAACDYVLIGDEFYAASAYLTRKPVLVGSLIGQDWCKISGIAMVLGGSLLITPALGIFSQKTINRTSVQGLDVPTTVAYTGVAAGEPLRPFEKHAGDMVDSYVIDSKTGEVQQKQVPVVEGEKVDVIEPRLITPADTWLQRFFQPQKNKALRVEREDDPKPKEVVYGSDPAGVALITAASNSNPCVLTATGHGLKNGDQITIYGGWGGWSVLNGTFQVTVLSPDTFSIPVDASQAGDFKNQNPTLAHEVKPATEGEVKK